MPLLCHLSKLESTWRKFLAANSRTFCFICYVKLSSLWTVNNTIFCLFWFLYISYGQRIMQYFATCFILYHLGTSNNTVFCLFCFLSPPLCSSKKVRKKINSLYTCQYFQTWWRNLTVI